MKISFLIQNLGIGGAQTQIQALARGLARHGDEVQIVSLQGPVGSEYRSGYAIEYLGKSGRYDVIGPGFRLIRHLRRARPDVLHTYLPAANLVGALMKPLLPGTRLVWGIRAAAMPLSEYDALSRATYRWQRRLADRADLVICNSDAARRTAIAAGLPEAAIRIVPNGFDTSRFWPDDGARAALRRDWGFPEDSFVFGHVGRIDPVKGHEAFLKAAALVSREMPAARFVCVGGGDPEALRRLTALAADLELGSRLVWAGPHEDMPKIYGAFDALVSSSRGESFPNVIGEAMACAVPCIATDVGGVSELLGDAGTIVPAEDAQALARAMMSMAASPESDRRAIAARARDRALTRFGSDRMVAVTRELLQSSIKKTG